MNNIERPAETAADSSNTAEVTTSSQTIANALLGDVYESILQLFTSKDDRRDWLNSPFLVGNKAAATNGYSLVAVPNWSCEYQDKSEKTKGVYPIEPNIEKVIPISELKEALTKVPLIDDYDEAQQKCDACYGDGTVDFEFEHNGKRYETESDCPVCDGEGVIVKTSKTPNGKKVLDYNKYIKIGNSSFNLSRIEDLLKVADFLKEDKVVLAFQSKPTQTNLFRVKNVDVLLLPSMVSEEKDVCANIA